MPPEVYGALMLAHRHSNAARNCRSKRKFRKAELILKHRHKAQKLARRAEMLMSRLGGFLL